MNVILLERINKLGKIGDIVRVKDGYARNFLLPKGKALRATEDNKQKFEDKRAEIEAKSEELRDKAQAEVKKMDGHTLVIIEQAGETGNLYGSVTARVIADGLVKDGFEVERSHIMLNQPIKIIGLHKVSIALHSEVETTIELNIARSPDEAERQAAGEDLRDLAAREDEAANKEMMESLGELGAADSDDDDIADDAAPKEEKAAEQESEENTSEAQE